ncbi:MAG: hypothetical protein FVQ82_04525 [Planctomycetes bacterium]|nr:hypothetical protein [Planctomycetota bacterium]
MGFIKSLLGILQGNNTRSEDNNTDLQSLDDDAIKAELKELVESGKKIAAISAARKAYNCGLREAKDIVEQL